MRGWIQAAVGTTVAITCGVLLISGVGAEVQSGWLSTADPKINKLVDLTPNVLPPSQNRDCIQQDYTATSSTGAPVASNDCFADSTLGKMTLFGSPMLFAGTDLAVGIQPNYPYLLQPIPNQGIMLSPRSAPVFGNYLYFYRDIRQALTPNYNTLGSTLVGYTINKEPDFQLKDKNNNPIIANDIDTLAYSSNGSWMMVDSPGIGFLRINMATFDIVPFADSLNRPGDTSSHHGVTAISDDGRFATVANFQYGYFKVYDLSTCTGTTGGNYAPILNCQYRDYWPYVSTHVAGFKNMHSLRFTNDDNLQAVITYNWQSSASFSAAKFTITAPGKQAHGLDYLALGDSYISGEGEFKYKTGTNSDVNKCHLSPLSHPYLVGSSLFNSYESVACSGARIKDITAYGIKNYDKNPNGPQYHGKSEAIYNDEIYGNFEPGYRTQISFVERYQPSVVTLSIGGNDIHFADLVTACVEKYAKQNLIVHTTGTSTGDPDCNDTYDERMRIVKDIDALYPKLQDTYKKILEKDPGVKLYVIGYPQVAKPGGNCGANVQLSPNDIDFSQQLVNYLDATIEQAANSVGARYVDVQHALDGHRLCEATAASMAMNGVTAGDDNGPFGLKVIGDESFHPNVLGHQLLAQAILRQTSNMTQAMPVANPSLAAPSTTSPIAIAFLGNYQPSGAAFPQKINHGYETAGQSYALGQTVRLVVDGEMYGLRQNSTYQVTRVTSDGVSTVVGSYQTDAASQLSMSYIVPVSSVLGRQSFRITGTNMAGQTVEVDEPIYVVASIDDYDGDGIPNSQEACGSIPGSGTDIDSDGIDDACDPLIGDKPAQAYPVTVRLTGNSVTSSR